MAVDAVFPASFLLRVSSKAAAPVIGAGDILEANLGDLRGGDALGLADSEFGDPSDCSCLPRFKDFVRAGRSGRRFLSGGAVVVVCSISAMSLE